MIGVGGRGLILICHTQDCRVKVSSGGGGKALTFGPRTQAGMGTDTSNLKQPGTF